MNRILWTVGLMAMTGSVLAAGMPCEQLKSEIDAKIKANGVSHYSLRVVDKGTATDGQVVGSCSAGKRDIAYKRL